MFPRVGLGKMAEHNDDWIKIEMTRFHWLVVLCTATGGRRRENKSPLLGCFFSCVLSLTRINILLYTYCRTILISAQAAEVSNVRICKVPTNALI